MTVLVLSGMMEIDWLHDGNRLVHPGPMMGVDRGQFHHLIGMDWAQNQSKVEINVGSHQVPFPMCTLETLQKNCSKGSLLLTFC